VSALRTGRSLHWDPAAGRFTGDGAKEGNAQVSRPMRKPYTYSFAG